MREILFKARRVDNGEWVEGYYFLLGYDGVSTSCIGIDPLSANDYGEIYRGCYCEIDPATLCQYTGLTDKNGVKIFEGDILQACDYPKDSLTFPVVWYEKHAGFNLMGLNTIAFNIIGNTHDKENNDG